MRLLKVSPGSGVFQRWLYPEITDKGELVVLDLSMNMLRQCKKRNRDLNVYLIQGNAEHLSLAEESFEALFHFGGVNLFNQPDNAIGEFVRVLRKGGLVS